MDQQGEETRDGFAFRGGHVALDLAATLKGRLKPVSVDLLATPRDLSRWLVAAELAPRAVRANQEDLDAARRLREAIYGVAMARIAGEAPPPTARATINRMAAGAPARFQLDADGRARLSGGVEALLAGVAQEAVRLLGGRDSGRVRQCEGETCAHLFVDASRAGDRRWCSMAACGNRAKVAEFRRRKRSG